MATTEVSALSRGPDDHARPSALPLFRACQQKVSKTWEGLQRRMARHSGAVAAHNTRDRPLLLAAAEDLLPCEWSQDLERWPEVARATPRLRPPDNNVPQSARPVYTPSPSKAAGSLELPGSLSLELRSGTASLDFQASLLSGIKTPPYARSPGLFENETPPPGSHAAMPSLDFLDADSTGLQASSFKDVQEQRRRNRPGFASPSPRACKEVMGKLQYLRECKEVMGGQRYGFERRRLELQADVKCAMKRSPRVAFGRKIAALEPRCPHALCLASSKRAVSPQRSKAAADLPDSRTCSIDSPRGPPHRSSTFISEQFSYEELSSPHSEGVSNQTSLQEGWTPQHSMDNAVKRTTLSSLVFAGAAGDLVRNVSKDTPSDSKNFLASLPGASGLTVSTEQQNYQATANLEYAHLCGQQKIAMPSLGHFAVDVRTEAAPLNADNWSLGDGPLIALAASPLRSTLAGVSHCRLSANRLTNAGVAAVVASLGRQTTAIDLAENSFDSRGIEPIRRLLERGTPRLRELNLSRNVLNDPTVAAVCVALTDSCPELEQLLLSEVQMGIGLRSGPALRMLLRDASNLILLDVSCNMLQGESALDLFNGVQQNGARGGALRNLNVSWNCLGQGPTHGKVAERLAQLLREGEVLFHLDVSFNNFVAEDCMILAKGLSENHTLWGIHVEGNAAIVNADGFIQIIENMGPEALEDAKNRISKAALMKGIGKKKKKGKNDKVSKRRDSHMKKGKGDAELNAVMEGRARYLFPKTALVREFTRWQQGLDAAPTPWREGLDLPEVFSEIVEPTEDDPGSFSRTLKPRAQGDWLQTLSHNIREEMRIPYLTQWCPLLGAAVTGTQHKHAAHCWLCEGWVEAKFVLTPGISFEMGAGECVSAFVSVDNFARPTFLRRRDDGRYEGERFLPPTAEPLLLVFGVEGRLEVAQDMPRQKLKKPLRIKVPVRPEVVGADAETADEGEIIQEVKKDHTREIQEVNLLFLEPLADARLAKAFESCSLRGDEPLREVPQELVAAQTRPRMRADPLYNAPPPWSLASSIWAEHPDLYEDILDVTAANAFATDWQFVRAKLIGWSEEDIGEVYRELRRFIRPLHVLYQKVSCRGDKDSFGVTLGSFSHLIESSGLLIAHPEWRGDSFDYIFVACKRVPPEIANHIEVISPDGLVRWQFLEMIARLGSHFLRAGESVGQAVERIMSGHMAKLAEVLQAELDSFWNILLTESMDLLFRCHLTQLRSICDFFTENSRVTSRSATQGRLSLTMTRDSPLAMSLREFRSFLNELGVVGALFPERLVPYAFRVGKALNPDEASSTQHLELAFVELLVSLAYVLYVRANGILGQTSFFEEEVKEILSGPVVKLSKKVLTWQDSPLFKHLVLQRSDSRIQRPGTSMVWLQEVQQMIARLCHVVDDDLQSALSMREVQETFARPQVLHDLTKLGVEPAHVEEALREAFALGKDNITFGKILSCLVRAKERLKNDEDALRFLRETLAPLNKTGDGSVKLYDPEQLVKRDAFHSVSCDPAVKQRKAALGISFDLMDFWEYVAAAEGLPSRTLGRLLTGYLSFRRAKCTGAKVGGALQAIFQTLDTSGSGELSRDEFMAVIGNSEIQDEMRNLGLFEGMENKERQFEASMALLFHELDQDDSSGTLSIREVLNLFLEMWEVEHERQFEEGLLKEDEVVIRSRIEVHNVDKFASREDFLVKMQTFGQVLSCHMGRKGFDAPLVRFKMKEDAERAMREMRLEKVFFEGELLRGEWRELATRRQQGSKTGVGRQSMSTKR